MAILNLTQHSATPEQIAQGVGDLNPHHGEIQQLKSLLTFESLPTAEEVYERAYAIAALAQSYFVDVAMIGGAPYLMGALERALNKVGIKPVYAFSERVSEEQVQEDGSVHKVNVFKHIGFVEVWL